MDEVLQAGIYSVDATIRTMYPFTNTPYQIARLPFSDIGKGISKYAFIEQLGQDVHEQILQKALTQSGVKIERSTVLTSLKEDAAGIHVTITGPNGQESASFRYVLGCDGAHSKVRHAIDVGFVGGE